MLGLDEAGRGPVIGPIVIAGVQITPKDNKELIKIGVKDSKQLTPRQREMLAEKIQKIAKRIEIEILSADEIDELMKKMTLNKIELNAFVSIINRTDAKRVFLDLPERGRWFAWIMKSQLKNKITLTAEHKADEKYAVVSAASIIAKVTRDREIKKIEKELGLEIRSGYPSDPHTINFIKKYIEQHKILPPHVRHSWETARILMGESKQKKLGNF